MRPDQRHVRHSGGTGGSQSGSGDVAGALGYPGQPPAAMNLQPAQALRRAPIGGGTFFTFTAPSRIWTVVLSYTASTLSTYPAGSVTKLFAFIQTGIASIPLAPVELSLSNPGQNEHETVAPPLPGLPVTQGDQLILNINGGVSVPGIIQEASAIVLYSTP